MNNPGEINKLKILGITNIASSREIIETEQGRKFALALKQSGINVFAFHINRKGGPDETHVVCKEREYFYGIYADDWSFSKIINCH